MIPDFVASNINRQMFLPKKKLTLIYSKIQLGIYLTSTGSEKTIPNLCLLFLLQCFTTKRNFNTSKEAYRVRVCLEHFLCYFLTFNT